MAVLLAVRETTLLLSVELLLENDPFFVVNLSDVLKFCTTP